MRLEIMRRTDAKGTSIVISPSGGRLSLPKETQSTRTKVVGDQIVVDYNYIDPLYVRICQLPSGHVVDLHSRENSALMDVPTAVASTKFRISVAGYADDFVATPVSKAAIAAKGSFDPRELFESLHTRLDTFEQKIDGMTKAIGTGETSLFEEIIALHGEVQCIQLPSAPPTAPSGRDTERHMVALRALFNELKPQESYVGATGSLPRDALASGLEVLRAELTRHSASDKVAKVVVEIAHLAGQLRGEDPAQKFEEAAEHLDMGEAIAALTRLAQEQRRGEPLTDEHIEAQIIGFAKTIWEWNQDAILRENHAVGTRLLGVLHLARLDLLIPTNEAYNASHHRIEQREQARPGEPVNQVIEVVSIGFIRTDGQVPKVIEKAAIVLSD
jgi:hypothetical protein